MSGRIRLSSPNRPPAEWSRKRRAALIVFALIMAYLQSFYILTFYTSGIEYWGTVWIGVTAEQRLLSFALGLFANLGLMTTPFLRAPGRILQAVIALSLGFGLLISITWLSHDFGALEVLGAAFKRNVTETAFLLIDIVFFALSLLVILLYAVASVMAIWFLVILARCF